MMVYPMIFGPHGGLVAGNGFVARVLIRGRCILEETGDDFFSVMGVNPGAVAGDGSTTGEAHHDFLDSLRLAVFSLAEDARDFQEFKSLIEDFFSATNRRNEDLWKAAVSEVRAGELDLAGACRQDADGDFWARVTLVMAEDSEPAQSREPIQPDLNESSVHEDFQIAVGQ
jgi:hypothetical protein